MIMVCSEDEIEYYLYNQFVGSRYSFRCSPLDHSFLRARMHDWDKHVWCTVHFLSIICFIIQYAKFKWENSNQIKKKSANTHLLQSINKPKRMKIQLKFHWWT